MDCRKITLGSELKRMARGQRTRLPARQIAAWAMEWVRYGLSQTEVEQLERLYRLKDNRE